MTQAALLRCHPIFAAIAGSARLMARHLKSGSQIDSGLCATELRALVYLDGHLGPREREYFGLKLMGCRTQNADFYLILARAAEEGGNEFGTRSSHDPRWNFLREPA
jgi:hypothetical protein